MQEKLVTIMCMPGLSAILTMPAQFQNNCDKSGYQNTKNHMKNFVTMIRKLRNKTHLIGVVLSFWRSVTMGRTRSSVELVVSILCLLTKQQEQHATIFVAMKDRTTTMGLL